MKFVLKLGSSIELSIRKTWFFLKTSALTISDLIKDIQETFALADSEYVLILKGTPVHPALFARDFISETTKLTLEATKLTLEATPPHKRPSNNSKRLKRELKNNPKIVQFQGKKVKFDETGAPYSLPTPSSLLIDSPTTAFHKQKSQWKAPPIPKRKPFTMPTEGTNKQTIKRFGEYAPPKSIQETYHYELKDFVESNPGDLAENQIILFKTLELNEDSLVPSMSLYKVSSMQKGKVDSIEGERVKITLLRDVQPDESRILEEMEVIDDLTLMKYSLLLEKKWIVDLQILKGEGK